MSPECRMSPCVSVLESDTDSVLLSKHAELTPTLPIHGQHWNVIYTELLLPQYIAVSTTLSSTLLVCKVDIITKLSAGQWKQK